MDERAKTAALGISAWAKAQQDYWNAWTNLGLQALAQTGRGDRDSGVDDWSAALQRWWEAVAPHYSSQADVELLEKLICQGQGYLTLGEQSLHLIETLQEAARNDEGRRKAVTRSIEKIRETFFHPFQSQDETHPGLAALWGLPIDTWQQVAFSLPPFPADASQASHSPISLRESLDKSLGLPALSNRAWQEQRRQGTRLWLDYQEANREYVDLLRQAANRSLDLLRDKLSERMEADQPLKRLRDLYNLWVDCSEQAYAEIVRGSDYSEVKGRMINALMRLKRHEQQIVDERLSALSIPTRAELNTTHARMRDMCRRIKQLEEPKNKP